VLVWIQGHVSRKAQQAMREKGTDHENHVFE
jgi:hypothetical protein